MNKYRLVIVNERGYSFMCELEAEPDFISEMVSTLRGAKGVVVVRADLLV